VSQNEPVGIGILGLGKAGIRHMEAANACADVKLIATADSAPAARARFDALPSLDALLETPADAIVVAVPHGALESAALAVIAAGKHVLLEKPMANTLADATRVVDAARAQGVRLMVNYNHRFRDEFTNARRLLEDGQLGEISFVSAHMFAPEGPLPAWVWDESIAGGGMMTYSGSHMIDRVLQCVGRKAEAVSATAGSFSYREALEDTSACWLRFDNGTMASFAQHKSNVSHREGSWETRLFGTKGAMRIVSGAAVHLSAQGQEQTIESGPDTRFEGALSEWVQAIREGREPSPGGDDGLLVRACLDAFYDSARSGGWKGIS